MTTYRYKSDTATSNAVYRFFFFGFMASFGVMVPAGVYIVLLNINQCGYVGYRAAVVILPIIQLASWLLVSLGMCLVYSMMTRDDPPTPPANKAEKTGISRTIKGSSRGRKGKFTFE